MVFFCERGSGLTYPAFSRRDRSALTWPRLRRHSLPSSVGVQPSGRSAIAASTLAS